MINESQFRRRLRDAVLAFVILANLWALIRYIMFVVDRIEHLQSALPDENSWFIPLMIVLAVMSIAGALMLWRGSKNGLAIFIGAQIAAFLAIIISGQFSKISLLSLISPIALFLLVPQDSTPASGIAETTLPINSYPKLAGLCVILGILIPGALYLTSAGIERFQDKRIEKQDAHALGKTEQKRDKFKEISKAPGETYGNRVVFLRKPEFPERDPLHYAGKLATKISIEQKIISTATTHEFLSFVVPDEQLLTSASELPDRFNARLRLELYEAKNGIRSADMIIDVDCAGGKRSIISAAGYEGSLLTGEKIKIDPENFVKATHFEWGKYIAYNRDARAVELKNICQPKTWLNQLAQTHRFNINLACDAARTSHKCLYDWIEAEQ